MNVIRIAKFSRLLGMVFIVGIVLSMASAPVAGNVIQSSAQQHNSSVPDSYSIIQDGECTTITSLGDGTESVEEFYDYRTPETDPESYTYSSYGTTELQQNDTSILFFYEGTEGTSLVLVHDRLDGGTGGGAITMQLNGLPEKGEWPVEDDNYSDDLGPGPFDEFDHGETSSRITWVWNDSRTDGAAFRGGLEDNFEVTVDPAFNDDADFRVYSGEVTEWQVLSGTIDDVERTPLDFQEITILPGPCHSFIVSEINAPETVDSDEEFQVSATVENDGNAENTFPVPFTVDGEVVDETEITLEPGAEADITTTMQWSGSGTHTVSVSNETADVTVVESDNTSENVDRSSGDNRLSMDDELSGRFSIVAAIGTLVVATAFWQRRR